MQAPSERASDADIGSGAAQDWLGNSVWQAPELEISKMKSWGFITAMNYHRGDGETIWRNDRHRIVLALDQLSPMLIQAEQGRTRQIPFVAPGTSGFFLPASRYGPPTPRRGSFKWSGIRICIRPCCQSLE